MNLDPVFTEWLANILNILCVILIVKNSAWNWLVGIMNCLLYILVFIPAKLYGDATLQVVYIGLSLYGVYEWLFGKGGIKANMAGEKTELPITCPTKPEYVMYVCNLGGLAIALSYLLKLYTNTDVPLSDGVLTATCLTATIMMAYRKLYHWQLWILSNVFYFPLYFHKGLYITMWFQVPLALYSIAGYYAWLREFKQTQVTNNA